MTRVSVDVYTCICPILSDIRVIPPGWLTEVTPAAGMQIHHISYPYTYTASYSALHEDPFHEAACILAVQYIVCSYNAMPAKQAENASQEAA